MSLIQRFMTRNVGTIDRIVRTVPFLVVALLWANGTLSGVALLVGAVLAFMLLITAITARCSIYAMLGFSTCPLNKS